jgi:hypothetical protein
MRWTFSLLILAAGCAYEVPGEHVALDYYPDEVQAAAAAWELAVGEAPGCDLSALRVVVAPPELLKELCGHTTGLTGCHSTVPRPRRDFAVVSARHLDEESEIVAHETMHWLQQCSGRLPDDDPEHADPAVWDSGGALYRACESLGLGKPSGY